MGLTVKGGVASLEPKLIAALAENSVDSEIKVQFQQVKKDLSAKEILPYWSSPEACVICSTAFGATLWRHNCWRCGQCVCRNCIAAVQQEKVCHRCKPESE